MEQSLQQESEKLARSWMQHDASMLRDYLVADVEDPRLNLQSILTRHFLISSILVRRNFQTPVPPEKDSGETPSSPRIEDRFRELERAELAFGATMNWLLATAKRAGHSDILGDIAYALQCGADNAEGFDLPPGLQQQFRSLKSASGGLQVPNYIEAFLRETRFEGGHPVFPQATLNTFQRLWNEALADMSAEKITVLEPACGSANDFRFLESYGIARFIDYVGLDICEKNITNAQALHPQTRFQVGNVFEIAAPDNAFECCFVHDLLEHLSPSGIEQAVRELSRVTRYAICIHFFSMEEMDQDVVNPVDDYHWNLLSMERMRERFSALGFAAQVMNIGEFQRCCTGFEKTHNPRAYTFLLAR